MTNTNTDDFQVQVHFERIMETISSRIYDTDSAFLRENVQNAIDAVRMQAYREQRSSGDSSYRIDVTVSDAECSIADNGVGMTREELMRNFWTMGASGKNTDEARAAGCIGTFGIGGFANFGVCDSLAVVSKAADPSAPAHRTWLARSAFKDNPYGLPIVHCESIDRTDRGTVVTGVAKATFRVERLEKYIRSFVRHVNEAVYFNGAKVSQEPFDVSIGDRQVLGAETRDGVTFQLLRDEADTLTVDISAVSIGGRTLPAAGRVKLIGGQLQAYRRGFHLCAVTIPSTIGVSGWVDCDEIHPTAGRDSLDEASLRSLVGIFRTIELAAYDAIVTDSELLASHIRVIPALVAKGNLEALGKLRVPVLKGEPQTLGDLRQAAARGVTVFFTRSKETTSTTEVLTARGHVIVTISGNRDRRNGEMQYLKQFCGARELEGLIECLEPYVELDTFERAVLSEIGLSIRRLFSPPKFVLRPGSLTLDTPIYWSEAREDEAVVVFVDTRHGELQKLKSLGYTSLFWSMIEAFCREFLGDTLRRQSPKFFGSGAVDLDAFSKSKAELWDLVIGDIAVSRVGASGGRVRGHVEVVRARDIGRVRVGAPEGETPTVADQKLLQIVDESNETGLAGYYLRIPQSATAAFGEIIRTFPTFAVVWFANRVTWQGSDLVSTAFLLDLTLDQLLTLNESSELAHGAMALEPTRVQTYRDQIYVYIPPVLESNLVPRAPDDVVKVRVRHELVDLNRPRSWTGRSADGAGSGPTPE